MGTEEITRTEIRQYVKILIDKNKYTYDNRLQFLLYEFFFRATEKFNWSRDEFIAKYNNFSRNVKNIKFEKLNGIMGKAYGNGISLNEIYIEKMKKLNNKAIYNIVINTFFHECLHQTDYTFEDGKVENDGLYEIKDGKYANTSVNNNGKYEKIDTFFNEYGNEIASFIISEDRAIYDNYIPITPRLDGYEETILPGSIMCASFDMLEPQVGILKDKGRTYFNSYLRDKYPNIDTDTIVKSFAMNMNVIKKAVDNDDRDNIILGHANSIEIACYVIENRINNIDYLAGNVNEQLERAYFSIFKLDELMQRIMKEYDIREFELALQRQKLEELWKRLYLKKQFFTNGELKITSEKEYRKMYNINDIVDKYYDFPKTPLNSNIRLIKQLEDNFCKMTFREKFQEFLSKMKKKKGLPEPQTMQPIRQVSAFAKNIEVKTSKLNYTKVNRNPVITEEKEDVEDERY